MTGAMNVRCMEVHRCESAGNPSERGLTGRVEVVKRLVAQRGKLPPMASRVGECEAISNFSALHRFRGVDFFLTCMHSALSICLFASCIRRLCAADVLQINTDVRTLTDDQLSTE